MFTTKLGDICDHASHLHCQLCVTLSRLAQEELRRRGHLGDVERLGEKRRVDCGKQREERRSGLASPQAVLWTSPAVEDNEKRRRRG